MVGTTKIRLDRKRLKVVEGGALPRELQRMAPRDVVLDGSGWMVAICAAVLALAGLVGGPLAWQGLEAGSARVAELRTAGVRTEAVVTEFRRRGGKEPRVTLSYRYTAAEDGREYTGRVRLREKHPVALAAKEGSKVRVVYAPSEPGRSWLEGREPEEKPMWLAAVPPLIGVPAAVALLLLLRRQRRLLSEGRAGLATVVTVESQSGDEKVWKLTYRWELPSGAARTGTFTSGVRAAEPGATLAIVYDAERPERHALYPVSLVRVR